MTVSHQYILCNMVELTIALEIEISFHSLHSVHCLFTLEWFIFLAWYFIRLPQRNRTRETSVHLIIYASMYLSIEHICFSCYVISDALPSHWLQPTRLLCPWESPGKNTGVSCPFLIERLVLRNWPTEFWGLVSPKSIQETSGLEIQGWINITDLNLRSIGWKLRQSFNVAVLRHN